MINLFRSKIFMRIFIAFFLIIVTTFIGLSTVLLTVTKSALEKQQLSMAEIYRVEVSDTIKSWLSGRVLNVKSQASLLGLLGSKNLSSPKVEAALNAYLKQDTYFSDLAIIDMQGNVINSNKGSYDNLNLLDRDYVRAGLKGKATITGFFEDRRNGSPIMAISEPIFVDGEPRCVLAGIIALEKIAEIIESLSLSELGHVYLVNEEGMFITDSSFIQEFIKNGGVKNKVKYQLKTFAVDKVIDNEKGTGIYKDFSGEEVIGAYEWLGVLKVGLLVEFKSEVVMAPIRQLNTKMFAFGIVIITFGFFLAFTLSRKLVDPINALINAADGIASESYQAPLNIKTNSELDKLVAQFNNMQQAIREREEQLKALVNKDGLTGLYNHSLLNELFDKEWSKSERKELGIAFAMLDIDYFKKVNDTYGHIAGDMVLKDVAKILKESIRSGDIVGRYGGEEFGLILLEADEEQTMFVCERIRRNIEEYKFNIGERDINITMSIGVCYAKYDKNILPKEIIKLADEQLYLAKNNGRNRVEMFA